MIFEHGDWPAPVGIVAGTTTRLGGASRAPYDSLNLGAHVGDDPAAVAVNRGRLSDAQALPSTPVWLRQVHGARVVRAPLEEREPEADACITAESNVICAVMTADCLPVLFAARDGSAVGAAHAGWRGLAAGVLDNTVAAFGCDPATLIAWLGPAISQPAYEVGDEVRRAFVDADPDSAAYFAQNAAERWQADLYGLARHRLAGAGVTDVYGGGRCTLTERETYFSHRRDGPCGRMASLIFRRGDG